jgi:hypothetical protein
MSGSVTARAMSGFAAKWKTVSQPAIAAVTALSSFRSAVAISRRWSFDISWIYESWPEEKLSKMTMR